MATDGDYEYYAVMTEVEDNSYLVTGWVDSEDAATSITEPQDETTYTIYVTDASMQILADLEDEPSVESLLVDARFHLLEEGGSAAEQQDEDALEYEVECGTVPGTATALAGAVFEVSNASGQRAYFSEEDVAVVETDENGDVNTYDKHIYLFEGWLDEDDEVPTGYTTSVVSASDGMIYIEGLDTGTYTVTEIAAPDGYNMLDESITVTIWAEYNENNGAIEDHGVTWTIGNDSGNDVVNVLNNAGSKLPGTGGKGTTLFYIIGAILLCGAAVVLIARRRMNSEAA